MWTTSSEHCRFVVWLHKLWTTETGQPANRPTWQSLAADREVRHLGHVRSYGWVRVYESLADNRRRGGESRTPVGRC